MLAGLSRYIYLEFLIKILRHIGNDMYVQVELKTPAWHYDGRVKSDVVHDMAGPYGTPHRMGSTIVHHSAAAWHFP